MADFNAAWLVATAIGIILVAADFLIPEQKKKRIGWALLLFGTILFFGGIVGFGHDLYKKFRKPLVPQQSAGTQAPAPSAQQPTPTPSSEGVVPIPKAKQLRQRERNDQVVDRQTAKQTTHSAMIPQQTISAPNGIAIGGGTVSNPIVNNYGAQPPRGGWQQSGPTYVEGQGYKNTVTFAVDRTAVMPQFVITCDAPCKIASSSDVRGLGFNQLTGKTIDDHRVAVEFSKLAPNSTVTVVLSATSTFTVTDVALER